MSTLRAALLGLTTRGRCLLSAGVALCAAALLLGQRDLLRVGVLLLALPLLAALAVGRTRYQLACERALDPPRVEAGRPTTVRLRLDNVSRLPSGVLLMEDALPYALGGRPRFVLERVEPRGVRDVTYPLVGEVRGRYRVGPLAVRLTDPFGLCELSRSFSGTSELVVTPVCEALPPVRLGGDGTSGGDVAGRSATRSGADDMTTREYRRGDDLRKVHWRSTARTGELMVRQEEQPSQDRATILLDTRASAHRGTGPTSSLEWAVSAAASVGVALARRGAGLRLVTDVSDSLVPRGVPGTEGALLEALAGVGLSGAADLSLAVAGLRRAGAPSTLIAVLGALDAADAERLAPLRQGSAAAVAVLLDTPTWGPGRDPGDTATALLTGAGWRVLRPSRGSRLADLWPLAGGRGLSRVPA